MNSDRDMKNVDLNLLVALDVLLAERSVTVAARRLGLSTSAMSRTLKRLRLAIGDPLLVRAGRGLVPTPHAEALGVRVHGLTRDVQTILRPRPDHLDLATLDRAFIIRANDSFVEYFAMPLVNAVTNAAPHVRLHFTPKVDKSPEPLREGVMDLEIGVVQATAPEMCVQQLFRDKFVGVARKGHPLLTGPKVTPERYADFGHVVVSRKGSFTGPVDDALAARGLKREIAVVVPGFSHALRIARGSDLIALVPKSCVGHAPGDNSDSGRGLQAFDLPVDTPDFTISASWHPRLNSDPAHQWLRGVVMSVCREPDWTP